MNAEVANQSVATAFQTNQKTEPVRITAKAGKPRKIVPKAIKTRTLATKKTPSKAKETCEASGEPQATSAEEDNKVVFRSLADFNALNELSTIMRDYEANNKIFLSRNEKKCLEEITNIAGKTRVPLDDRQMHLFNKDADKFNTKVTLPEGLSLSDKEVSDAASAINETPSKIFATELSNLRSYLCSLKNLIATREVAWANTTENDYAQKVEISRLKTEINHLRVVCSKKQTDLSEKDRVISEKDKEIVRLQKVIQKLKMGILQLEKNAVKSDEEGSTAAQKMQKSANLKMMEELLLSEVAKGQRSGFKPGETRPARFSGGPEPRKNQGPAALLANALYKARNAGNFVNF